jgi:hypothetical protein
MFSRIPFQTKFWNPKKFNSIKIITTHLRHVDQNQIILFHNFCHSMKKSYRQILLTLPSILIFTSAMAGVISPYADKFLQLKKIASENFKNNFTTNVAAENISLAYRERFGEVDIESFNYSDDDIRTIFDATSMAAFYKNDISFTKKMHLLYDKLKDGGVVDTARGLEVYQAYIASEQFEEANKFSETNTHLDFLPLPKIEYLKKVGKIQEWSLSPGDGIWKNKNFSLPSGPYLIITSSPHCHFSVNSMEAIKNSQYYKALTHRMKWLMRVSRDIDFDEISVWNEKYQNFNFSIAKNYPSWEYIDNWDTPTFYFFSNTVLVFKFSGWPAQGNFTELERGMRVAGFFHDS